MARKKTAKKTARKKSTRKKTKKARGIMSWLTASTREKATHRKVTAPKVAAHGKTIAARQRYVEYLGAKKKLIKEYFG